MGIIVPAVQLTLKFCAKHDLVAIEADKSKRYILCTRSYYVEQCLEHLSDPCTYTRKSFSAKAAYENRNKKYLDILAKIRSRVTAQPICSAESLFRAYAVERKSAKFRGLFKDHKSGIRPIVNTRDCPGAYIGKVLLPILNELSEHHLYELKGAYHLIARMDGVVDLLSHPDVVLASLDVKAMFTNITWARVREVLVELEDRVQEISPIPFNIFLDLVKFAAFALPEFTFNDKIYHQIRGLRVGAVLSPILAKLVMTKILDKASAKLRPLHLYKYVDDILIIDTVENVITFRGHMKAAAPEIDTDVEWESLDTDLNLPSIHYLNLTLLRDPKKGLLYKWYRKEYASHRFLNALSVHATSVKYNTIVEMIHTSRDLTHPDLMSFIDLKITDILYINGYDDPGH